MASGRAVGLGVGVAAAAVGGGGGLEGRGGRSGEVSKQSGAGV